MIHWFKMRRYCRRVGFHSWVADHHYDPYADVITYEYRCTVCGKRS